MLEAQNKLSAADTVTMKIIKSFRCSNNKKEQIINLIEAKDQGGYGASLLLVANNLFDIKKNKDSKKLKKLFSRRKQKNSCPNISGIIYVMALDNHPAPGLRSSMAGIPVLIEYLIMSSEPVFAVIIGRSMMDINVVIFKDTNKGYEPITDYTWDAHFLYGNKKSKLFYNQNVFFTIYNNGAFKHYLSNLNYGRDCKFSGFRGIINGPATSITPLMPIFYPYCPFELAVLRSDIVQEKKNYKSAFNFSLKINDVSIDDNQLNKFYRTYIKYLISNNFAAKTQRQIALKYIFAKMQDKYYQEKIVSASDVNNIRNALKKFCYENKMKFEKIYSGIDKNILFKNKRLLFKFNVSKWVKNNATTYDKIKVTEDEINKFYDAYKWAYCYSDTKKSEPAKLENIRNIIIQEIKRLKYYGLGQFITSPPKVEIIWEKEKVKTSSRRGLLEVPSPEKFAKLLTERPKPPENLAFSPAEFAELLKKKFIPQFLTYTLVLVPMIGMASLKKLLVP
ncbi:MAG: hypothetical protein KAS17_11890 [Victivallaceae bacterium]|nr:hypothetical protein [Victivallaceae bacterium]